MSVPDAQAFLLDAGEMRQARKEERIQVRGVIGTRNNPPRNDIAYFVALVGREIEDDPNINPAVGFFIAVELGPVHRKHDDRVVVVNPIAWVQLL